MESLKARIPTRPAFGVLLAFLILYPWLYHHVLPQDTQWIPDTSTAFVIVAFTVMGVGLNVVVGYAGLLDLGLRGVLRRRRVCGRLVRLAAVRRRSAQPAQLDLRRNRAQRHAGDPPHALARDPAGGDIRGAARRSDRPAHAAPAR